MALPALIHFSKLRGVSRRVPIKTRQNLRSRMQLNLESANLSRLAMIMVLAVSLFCFSGCRAFLRNDQPAQPGSCGPELANPMTIPMLDRWLVMDEISDELDDYFRIYKEERIRVLDSVMTEGWIETHPKIGSTILEPWHHDSTRGFERNHASLQTVRRFAKVRVIPTGNSFNVDVKVFKELEDNPNPTNATVSGKIFRTDNALDVDNEDPWAPRTNDGWIPMGRDFSLEQQILRNIYERLNEGDLNLPLGSRVPIQR